MNAKLWSQAIAELCLRPGARPDEIIAKAQRLITEKYRNIKWAEVNTETQKYIAKAKGIDLVEITSTEPVNEDQKKQFELLFSTETYITYKTNRKILGGNIIKQNGRTLDLSYATKLNNIKTNIEAE